MMVVVVVRVAGLWSRVQAPPRQTKRAQTGAGAVLATEMETLAVMVTLMAMAMGRLCFSFADSSRVRRLRMAGSHAKGQGPQRP